jgi:N-acetylmuramoyl-L-alanine amidase
MDDYKPLTDVRYLIVHCSASPPSMDIGAKEIDRWHRQRGFLMIGYHKVIRRNGVIEDGRPLDRPGAHVAGYNQYSIGVCLVGGEDAHAVPENNFTPEQFATLRSLLSDLKLKFPKAEILGHRDMPNVAKACPSFDVRAWLASA